MTVVVVLVLLMILLSPPIWKDRLLENPGLAFPAHFLSGLNRMISGKA